MNTLQLNKPQTQHHSSTDNPLYYMKDSEWQEKFEQMKRSNIPTQDKKLSRKCNTAYIVGRKWSLSNNGNNQTLDTGYCKFITGVLNNIRTKTKYPIHDYCYFDYQVRELLRFEPDLQTRLVPDGKNTYIEVWLEK